jgi:hypothetical protein
MKNYLFYPRLLTTKKRAEPCHWLEKFATLLAGANRSVLFFFLCVTCAELFCHWSKICHPSGGSQ